ncbi:M24 family metallopeptidase [Halobaculum sp. MBLA0147]|uniref:M24 family metallopeptidase n=1 Tax=Halobaculum sp. MBLA0147 TaxID=3079934 RepID=UPI0035263351
MNVDERAARLDALLDAEGYEAVWLGRPDSFAWATGGGDNRVDRTATVGEAAVGYLGDGEWQVVTNAIEAERLAAEELPPELSMSVVADPWHETTLPTAVAARSPNAAAADFDVPGLASLDATRLRLRLTEADRERYRRLGGAVGAAVERVCRELQPDDTEREVAAALRVGLAGRDIDAPVVLVGGGERAPAYRHPTPTTERLGEYAVVSVTARRGGMYVSCTRTVAFDPPEWLAAHHDAARRVETAALAATERVAGGEAVEGHGDGDTADAEDATNAAGESDTGDPDTTAAEIDTGTIGRASAVFDAIQTAYADAGYEGEWREHHQGGGTGYAGREWIATPDSDAPVVAPAAYAWNPTVAGAKSEDTALVTDEGVELVTTTGEWPTTTVSVDGLALERPDVVDPR